MTDDEFREKMLEAVKQFSEDTNFDEDVWKAFAAGLFYVAGDIADRGALPRISPARLAEIEKARHTGGNVLFYLSTQPSQYARAAQGLGAAGLEQGQRLAAAGGGKAVRARPGQRARIERPPARGLRRIRRLPHRPLPGQRNRAEYPGVSLRQRHFRAACGTGATSTTCRSPARNRSGWKAAARITRKPARWPT